MKPTDKSFGNSVAARRRAFTLTELLVVISIMGILAGFTIPVLKMVKRWQYLKTARAEFEPIETALENYKAKYNSYPPGNGANTIQSGLTNQLYYELSGTINNGTSYVTLDGSSTIGSGNFTNAFNVGGILNCTKGGGEDDIKAKNFLSSLKRGQIGTATFNGVAVTNLVVSVHGPDAAYKPVGIQDMNPFRYVYPGVNNPGSYDLWVQLVINGQTNLLCNWSRQVQINSSLP